MQEANVSSPFYQMGFGIAQTVFYPDYYKGPWRIIVDEQSRGDKHYRKCFRDCKNHATAEAWAKHLQRKGFRFLRLQKIRD